MNIYRFVTDQQDPSARGREIGQRFAQQIQQTVQLYLDCFPRLGIDARQVQTIGERSLAALEAWSPELASEIMGLAAGARLPLWQLASLNARTEILAAMAEPGKGECSTSVYAPAGPQTPRTLQTWDWHDSLAPHGLMLQLRAPCGITVKLFTEFGMLGKIGVNSAGLGLHFNILHHASDNTSGGVPVHAIARRLLEEASSVEQAIELARSARVSASTVLTVFSRHDTQPRAASIELSPARLAVVHPRADGWLLHTNHFLDPQLSLGERTTDRADTHGRLEHLDSVVAGMTGEHLQSRAAAMCGPAGARAPICFHPDPNQAATERWETLLSIGIDTRNCQLEYAAGNPYVLARSAVECF